MLYKYMPPERTDVLERQLIRFTPYTALNDPFECRFTLNPIEREREAAIEDDYLAEWAQVEVWLEGRIGQLGMLSLSRTHRNILMWTHYAKEHRGYVLGFDETHPFFQATAYYIEPTYRVKEALDIQGFGSLRDVTYTQERPNINFGGNVPFDAFFTKSLDWNYEQEVRIFRHLSEAAETLGDESTGIKLFRLPRGVAKRIILGAHCPADIERTVIELANSEFFAGAEIDRARLNKRDYSLEFETIIAGDA